MPYFVTYELEYRKTFERTNAKNVILKKTHPIEWASRSSEFYLTYLLFFAEITDEQVELSNNFCTIED